MKWKPFHSFFIFVLQTDFIYTLELVTAYLYFGKKLRYLKDCLKTEIHTDKFAVFRCMMLNQQLKRCNKKVTVNVL